MHSGYINKKKKLISMAKLKTKFYTANYSKTDNNFIIQNLEGKRVNNKYLPAILILKNILQRGNPIPMSKFLQSKIGNIRKKDNFESHFALIDKKLPIWNHTIKGDDKNNYYPAKTFFEKTIHEELPEYKFITQLIRPETPINEITQKDDEGFKHQEVDFYLSQAFLVIEIDGQQHKTDKINKLSDIKRDKYLVLHKVKTIRIDIKDLKNKTLVFYSKIEEIRERLNEFDNALKFYQKSYEENISEEIIKQKLLPTAIIRFQILILKLLEFGKLNLNDEKWNIDLLQDIDTKNFAELAIEDLFIWFEHLLKLQKIDFKKPKFKITDFIEKNNIKIDFSLLKRWTDENELNENIIYVRTDYFNQYYDRIAKKFKKVNNFNLSTTKPVKYILKKDNNNDNDNDEKHLEFFLENIFGYKSFNKGQYPIIKNALERKDTIGLLPTGGGKSLTYQIPCLLQPCISFVVCPIISLMRDQKKDLEDAYFQNTETITSETTGQEREQILNNFGNGKYFFVFISPERFQAQKFRDRLSAITANHSFAYAVIDEVHCLSEWGHDFRTSYLNLAKAIRNYCDNFNFLGLTATASVHVLKDIQIELNIKQEDVITLIVYTRPELEFIVIKDKGDKYTHLKKILQKKSENENIFEINSDKTKCGLIFTPNVNGEYGCFPLANNLQNDLNTTVKFYSGKEPNEFPKNENFKKYKHHAQDDFKDNKFSLLTATKAFGMGINKGNIDYTFHYGIPSSMEALYQEAGRAGRKKQKSKCYVLLSEEKENIENLFSPNATHQEIENFVNKKGRRDVSRQLYLYKLGLEPIETELKLLIDLHTYSKPNSKIIVTGNTLGASRSRTERAIYRLLNLGIIKDWTVEYFSHGGVFAVYYNNYTDKSIEKTLLAFIRKYEDNFEFDDKKEEHKKYIKIIQEDGLSIFEKYAKILLQWSYDKFAYNRRESLGNVYRNSLAYRDTKEGRENYKKILEAYFKFTKATYILQHIAENNDKDFEKWFEVFYDENNNFITKDKLIGLEGNLQRFLESYQNNTGLNLINALVILFLNKSLVIGQSERFTRALEIISKYSEKDYNYIIDQILKISKQFTQNNKEKIMSFLSKIIKSEEERIYVAKELNNKHILLECYNKKLKRIIKKINNEIRKVR